MPGPARATTSENNPLATAYASEYLTILEMHRGTVPFRWSLCCGAGFVAGNDQRID